MKANRATRRSREPLEKGQIWALKGATVRITEVGKTLVFYKRIPDGLQRVPTSLSSVAELEEFLRTKRARIVKRAS